MKKNNIDLTRLKTTYKSMRTRCYNSKQENYCYYGGRGITVSPEWLNSRDAYIEWALANGYRDDLTLDRIDTNGNYGPDNCRWATRAQQGRNRRSNVLTMAVADEIRAAYAAGGVTMRELASRFGYAVSGIHGIIHGRNWWHETEADCA